jgi:prepilin-type processing-associated H-X9-DG protein
MGKRRWAFTLIELMVVMGLISVMLSLLLPVVGKARAAARSTACLSNVRQIGLAWQLYVAENRGNLLLDVNHATYPPDVVWEANWMGVAEHYQVRGDSLLCPAASDPSTRKHGYGSTVQAWNGQLESNGSQVKLNNSTFRVGSYGFNGYLVCDDQQTKLTAFKDLTHTPVFFDCAWYDTRPDEQNEEVPVDPPPDLNGNISAGSPAHWRFLLARHGRGINVCFADGSARWVPLEDTYRMKWNRYWKGYHLTLPSN